jgi:hypothetical protein
MTTKRDRLSEDVVEELSFGAGIAVIVLSVAILATIGGIIWVLVQV